MKTLEVKVKEMLTKRNLMLKNIPKSNNEILMINDKTLTQEIKK